MEGNSKMMIESVNIDDQTDFTQLANESLHGRIGYSRSTTDSGPLDWLFRAWPRVKSTVFADRLARAIGGHVVGSDESTKYAALLFFVNFPDAAQRAPAPLHQAYANRAGFRGVFPPDGGSADLEWWLMRAIASLATTGEAGPMALIEQEALCPDGKVEPIIHTLVTQDGAWFSRHRDEILRLHPDVKPVVETIEKA